MSEFLSLLHQCLSLNLNLFWLLQLPLPPRKLLLLPLSHCLLPLQHQDYLSFHWLLQAPNSVGLCYQMWRLAQQQLFAETRYWEPYRAVEFLWQTHLSLMRIVQKPKQMKRQQLKCLDWQPRHQVVANFVTMKEILKPMTTECSLRSERLVIIIAQLQQPHQPMR